MAKKRKDLLNEQQVIFKINTIKYHFPQEN